MKNKYKKNNFQRGVGTKEQAVKENLVVDMILSGGGTVIYLEKNKYDDTIVIEILTDENE